MYWQLVSDTISNGKKNDLVPNVEKKKNTELILEGSRLLFHHHCLTEVLK